MKRLNNLPIPAIATTLASLTLGNVYGGLGYDWLRTLIMICGTIVLLAYLVKIIFFSKTCLGEYNQVISSSLYATFPMCMMILGAFFFEKGLGFGKGLWWAGVIIHFIHIVVFTVMHAYGKVYKEKDFTTMMPSWFVTYNGWMVACVTGGAMNAGVLLKIMTVYGCLIYPVLLFFIVRRLLTMPIKKGTYHTLGVLLAPCSFCVIALVNSFEHPPAFLMWIMYGAFLLTLFFLFSRMPKFFSFDFYPGFAGISFPMALGIVASQKMAAYLTAGGHENAARFCLQLSGLQLFVATMIVGYCVIQFLIMLLRIKKQID